MDEDIAAAIPEDIWEGKAARNLHVVIVPPPSHSEEHSDIEGLRVVPVRPPPGYQVRVLSAGMNYTQVRALLARCEEAHGTVALGGSEDGDPENAGFRLQDLMVIDCESERLVPLAPGFRFVALSYVWGTPRDDGHDHEDGEPFQTDLRARRRPLPRTVRDAMHVVRELGLQFLWVDRYCIDDDDDDAAAASKKHHIISNMDAVYRQAVLTIVAASGAHSDHGLPGARGIHHRLYTYSLAENGSRGEESADGQGMEREAYLYISDAHAQLSELVWSTRGWTYQEGLLSRHLLVFTETQIVFQCQQDSHGSGSGLVARSEDIFYRIDEYKGRYLTYPADSLRAFLGVLRAFEKLSPPAEHLWGVPFVSGTTMFFRAGWCVLQPAQGLLWKSQSRGLRRIRGIPSWSWAGWDGWAAQPEQQRQRVQQGKEEQDPGADYSTWMYGPLRAYPSLTGLNDVLVEVPSSEGTPISLEAYFRAQREGRGRRGLPPGQHAIDVTAWTAEISFSPERRLREYVLELDALHGGGEKTWTVAVMCWEGADPVHAELGLRTQCLVLDREDPESFCRVGTLETSWHKDELDEDGEGGALIAAWDRHFVKRRLRIV